MVLAFRSAALLFLALFTVGKLTAQSAGSIEGVVTTGSGEPLPGINVIIQNTSRGAATDVSGYFKITDVEAGTTTLLISGLGFEKQTTNVIVSAGKPSYLKIKLAESATELAEISITGKSELTEIRQQAFNISAINAGELKNSTQDINQVLGKVTGVRVREEGGLGSGFNFSLNGFSGNQIKFFLDGIPMDNFGSSLTLNNIPINLAERIEVYKGVVPVWLGSDALGGAVNVVTNQNIRRFIDLSYSYGSFNTHRASVNSRFTNEKAGLMLNANVFYNYSDNDYLVKVSVPDPVTKKYGPLVNMPRFHDAYESATLQLEGGLTDKPYADKLLLGIIVSGNEKEVQTGVNMNQVVGDAFTTDKVLMPTFKYKKNDLFIPGLSLNAYASYNVSQSLRADSSSRRYDWSGNWQYEELRRSGELAYDKTLFTFDDDIALASVNAGYTLNNNHSFNFNYTFSSFTRIGDDPLAVYPIPFDKPNRLAKNVLGLSYKLDLFDNRWSATLFAKSFMMQADVVDAEWGDYAGLTSSYNEPGFGVASTFFIFPSLQLKASYENTYRLPEGYEMFGNGLTLLPSPSLLPEQSKNLNAGLKLAKSFNAHHLDLESGFFYRRPQNLIRLFSEGITGTYVNHREARITGVEGDIRYTFKDIFRAGVNLTYQDIINTSKYENGAISYIYLDRLPNMPFLFGNAQLGLQFKEIGLSNSALSLNWSALFVEAFYLKWPSYGQNKFDIPRQFSQDASVTYSMQDGMYNISLECRNITNRELYDNFRQQKPGRAVSVKVRYFLAKRTN